MDSEIVLSETLDLLHQFIYDYYPLRILVNIPYVWEEKRKGEEDERLFKIYIYIYIM